MILEGGPVDLKQKAFVLKTVLMHEIGMCEGVGKDSGNGA